MNTRFARWTTPALAFLTLIAAACWWDPTAEGWAPPHPYGHRSHEYPGPHEHPQADGNRNPYLQPYRWAYRLGH